MDFSKLNITVQNAMVNIKINPTIWDRQPTLYTATAYIDGGKHKIDIVRCGYLGLPFLLVDNQPTVQMYGSKKTVSQNVFSIGITDAGIAKNIFRYAEYDD